MPGDYRLWNEPSVVKQFQPLDVPFHEQQVEVLLRLLPFEREQPIRILDLGCGAGTLLETMLNVFPKATGVGADFSAPMLTEAGERLAPFGDRVQLARVDFNSPDWGEAVPGTFDAIVSRYAIHHVPDPVKRRVYETCHSLLARPGVFINVEHVASATPYVEGLFNRSMVDSLYEGAVRRGERVTYGEVEERFHNRPDKAANILAPVEPQLTSLREAGFTDVDCYWKFFGLAVFGGFKW